MGFGWTQEVTDVCCWGGDIIYVDADAMGARTGVDWENAYTDLRDALARADKGCRDKIWVADGTYKPGPRVTDSFEIPDNVEVYGGFCGDEPNTFDLDDRDIRRYETVLSGYIHTVYDSGGNPVITRNETVVTMGDETILDGFTVEEGDLKGVEGDNVSFSISNSFIIDNDYDGISCKNGDVYIQWCEVKDNGRYGIYHDGSSYSLDIENCKIHGNQQDGILIDSSALKLISSLVYSNGQEGDSYGINLLNPSSSPTIRNNTIVHNVNEGIKFAGVNDPNVYNCIIYFNNKTGSGWQLAGLDTTYNCCIYDPNNPEGTSTPDNDGNITCDPNFAYDYPLYGYYHLDFGSHCRDGGDSDQYPDEFDIDGEARVFGYYVDIGADEATCEDAWNIADFTADGLVRLEDFYLLSAAYLSHDPNEPGLTDPNLSESWNPICNLDDTGDSTYTIDLADFTEWMNDWLWVACWHDGYNEFWMMSSMGGGGEGFLLSESLEIQSETVPVEKSIEEQLADAKEIIVWLEEISKEKDFFEHIEKDAWYDFVDKIYDWLDTLDFDVKIKE